MVPYVDEVVAVTVMRVLLFVLHVFLLRECDGVRLTAMLVHVVQVWCLAQLMYYGWVWCVECEELVECVRCVCFVSGRRGWRGGEWMRGLGLDFTNRVGTGGVLDVCLCLGCGCVGGVGRELGPGSGGWGSVMSVRSSASHPAGPHGRLAQKR